jgi:5-methylthioadenosine/S-adenosylhomocysteine deaminase
LHRLTRTAILTLLTLLACCTRQNSGGASVDTIWTARYVVTEDAQRRVIENGAIAILNDRIVEVGPRAEIDRKYTGKNRIDQPDAILAPGLINTHTHAAM